MAIKKNIVYERAFTLIEVLVVVSLFVVIAIITTQSLIRILSSTSSSNSSAVVRENLEHAIATIDRSIRNAEAITSCTASPMRVEFRTADGQLEDFECSTIAGNNTIDYNNQQLISSQVDLTVCSITCSTPPGGSAPNSVSVELEGVDTQASYDNAPVNLQTTVNTRSY